MKIGMMIATERELKAFLESGSEITEKTVGTRKIYYTEMYGHEICAVRSGFGELDAAAGTQFLITVTGCEMVLNFGVAGALLPGLHVEDLFVVRRVLHYDHDLSAVDPVKPYQYEEFADEFLPMDDSLIGLVTEEMPEIRQVTVASGDCFIADRARKDELGALGCSICDMESAAIARVCYTNQVRCLSIKCISDTLEGDGSDYEKNVINSTTIAFHVIREVLKRL